MIPSWLKRERRPSRQDWLAALPEPAALAAIDGRLLAVNAAWSELQIAADRAPKGLYAAFRQARAEGFGEAPLGARIAHIAAIGDGAFLIRAPAAIPVDPAAVAPALEAFAATSPFGIALTAGPDPARDPFVEVNAALSRLAPEAGKPGAGLAELIGEAAAIEIGERYRGGASGPFEASLTGQRAVHLYVSGGPAGAFIHVQDVTDQTEMQSRLAQRNRMEAVGQLAGGVAHDFNNLLSAIRLRADELLLRHALGDPSYDNLAEIRETVGRAAGVVRQLLTFSRKATLQREAVDLGEALTDTSVLLRRLVREDVELTIDYGANLPQVKIDRSQLETAIINLVVNARDALRARGGGTVRIAVARLTLAEAKAVGFAGPDMAELALLEVADDGPGIAPEALARIFEPFFTTKPLGEGTGLGLATVYGVVKQADGWISATSTLGEGATFRIFLPVHTPPLAFEPAGQAAARPAPRDLSGAGRILFVEDEALVRGVAARLLRARGYEVIEAADGLEAMVLAEQHAGTIDLMISDVIMPGMDGPTLMKEIRPFLGPAPVMFISGYAEAEFSNLLEDEPGVSFLAKPLDIKTLAERVKAELRPPGQAA
jgi:two-component system cell cycle sensor histidine kinase/response regulator CckA